jgi:hypothetical protein
MKVGRSNTYTIRTLKKKLNFDQKLGTMETKFYFTTRIEIISDVVSEKARSGKIPIPHRKYRYHKLFLTVHAKTIIPIISNIIAASLHKNN